MIKKCGKKFFVKMVSKWRKSDWSADCGLNQKSNTTGQPIMSAWTSEQFFCRDCFKLEAWNCSQTNPAVCTASGIQQGATGLIFAPTRCEVVSCDSSLASLLVGSALHLWPRMRDDYVHTTANNLSVAALLRVAHVPHPLSPNLGRRAGVCFVSETLAHKLVRQYLHYPFLFLVLLWNVVHAVHEG